MVIQTGYKYIMKDSQDSEPHIEGTRITVSRIVVDMDRGKNMNGKLEMLISLYPKGYLSREKILAAMNYYKNNKEEIEIYINESIANSGKVFKTR